VIFISYLLIQWSFKKEGNKPRCWKLHSNCDIHMAYV